MGWTRCTVMSIALPAIAALFGIFWFRRKSKPPKVSDKEDSKDKLVDTLNMKVAAPFVYVTQASQATSADLSFDVLDPLLETLDDQTECCHEMKTDTDSEGSIESVVTAIETSNLLSEYKNVNDVGVLEDTSTAVTMNTVFAQDCHPQNENNPESASRNQEVHHSYIDCESTHELQMDVSCSKNDMNDHVMKETNHVVECEIKQSTDKKLFLETKIEEDKVKENGITSSWSDMFEKYNRDKEEEIQINSVNEDYGYTSSCLADSDPKHNAIAKSSRSSPESVKDQAGCSRQSIDRIGVNTISLTTPIACEIKSEIGSRNTQRKNKELHRDVLESMCEEITDSYSNVDGHMSDIQSDNYSEVSFDSGKASSLSESTSTSSSNLPDYQSFEFDFPSDYCGRLIGKMGKNINTIKAKSGAEISLKRKAFTKEYQVCILEGKERQVNSALDMIKQRFPPRQFPGITYEQLNIESPILPPEIMQLSIPDGVSVDVIVSSVVDANHIFVQQPTHPTFSSLERLAYCMNACYTQDSIVPQLPRPIDVGVICAAPMYQGWFRAQVVKVNEEDDECDVKFVDYGGYMHINCSVLRQIRSDFTTLPFQAVECYMAHVVPPKGKDSFEPEAAALLEQLVHNQLLQAQIHTHEVDGVPYIQLYKILSEKAFFINRELVNKGIARWMEMSS